MERLESRRKRAVLLYVTFHEAGYPGDAFYAREELGFLGVVVVVHGLTPALAVGEEIAGGGEVAKGDVRGLEEDGV